MIFLPVNGTLQVIDDSKRPRVLIVCKEESHADYYKTAFTYFQCEPTNAWSPDHAIEIVQNFLNYERPFHLVCMEFLLNGMNGITLARNLQAIDPNLIFHMFPTSHQGEAVFLEEYNEFGGFKFPPSDSHDVLYQLRESVTMEPIGVERR